MSGLVSIVLPTYNGSRFIREALDSIVAQTWTAWELIVVDDASTDGVGAIVRDYAARDPRIRMLRHERNRYLPAALNTGFAEARGGYHTWIADDNLFRPAAVETMMRYLDAHPAIGLVYSAASLIAEDGAPLRLRPASPPHELHLRNPVGWCFMYPRAVAEAVGPYDEACFCAEDYDYWLRIACAYPLGVIEEDLFLYRVNGQSLTATKPDKCRYAEAFARLKSLPRLRGVDAAGRALAYYEVASYARGAGRKGMMLRALAGAFAADPGYAARRLLGLGGRAA